MLTTEQKQRIDKLFDLWVQHQGAGGQLVQDAVGIPHVEIRILSTGISGIGLAGLGYQLPLVIN